MHPPEGMPEPEYRPSSVAGHLPCRRCLARYQEELHRQWGTIRPVAARKQGCGGKPEYGGLHTRTDYPPRKRTAESGPRTYQRPGTVPDAETAFRTVLPLQAHLRQAEPGTEPAPAAYPLFHQQPSGMHGRRHGRTGSHHQEPGLPPGTGSGLHPYPDDRSHRSLVHGIPPLHTGTGLLGQDTERETGSTKPEERRNIISELKRMGRSDLIDKLYQKKR